MKYSNTVEYNIKTSLDSKGLTQLKSELQGLELKLQNMGNKGLLDEKTFVDARNQIQGLGQALSDAFNPSLGMLDLSKLNQELKNNDVTAQGLKTAFSSLGAEGQVAFNNLVGELGKLDTGILRTNSQIDKLFTTFSNTFRWGLVSSFFSQFMNAIHSSVDYVKELDDSLTQIMLVTDYNRDSMNEFARSANEAAKAVSMTTTGMTNASLIFAQQGYDLGQSQELATLSAKVANASQQDTATTSDQITAYMNAYGLENNISELTQAMDNWALIANISAADVGELAQASQRAASMANAVGVSGEQLASQIATIESVTREAPEQIGNGLKTLYARFSDIAAGGEDEDGFSLGKVTSELNKIGVQVLNEMGQIRDVGDIMEDLMVIWDDLDQTSKVAASQALAGKYQVNRFMALMDNSDMYQEYKGATGTNAAGTLDMMNEEYAQSIEGRSAKLQASLEGLFSTIFNTDDIYPWMDAAQGAIDLLQQFFDALGGGKTVLLGISSLLMQVFNKNIAQEINNAATNRAVQQQKLENLQNSQAALTTLGAANPNPNDANSQNILSFARYMQANAKNFNAEQMDQANSILQELVQNSNAATMAADKLKESLSVIGTGITATTGESILAPFLDSEGAVNATVLSEALQNMSQNEVAEMFSHIQEDIKPAREGLLEFNKALQNYQQELRKTNSTDDSWNQSLANLRATLDNLQGKIDPSTYERYEQAVNEIAEVTDKAGDKTAETTAEVAKLADGLEKVAAKDLTNLDQLNKDAFQAKNTQMAAEDSNKVAGAFQEGMGSQAYIQEILDTMNAVQQLTFAWQTFQNLGSLWANEDLSTGEKVLQTVMNLTMAMPQLISAMQTLQDNSFLQNAGNGLMEILNGNFTTVGDLEEIGKNNVLARIQKVMAVQDEGIAAYDKVMKELGEGSQEVDKSLEILYKGGEAATNVLQDVDDELIELAKNGNYTEVELTGLAKVFAEGVSTAFTEGATGLGLFSAGLKAVAAEAWAFITGPAAPFIIAGAAIAAIAVAIGQAQEQAKKAHEQAMADFEDAKNAQQQAEEFSAKVDSWKSKRQENGDSKELAQEADKLADSLRDAGNAAEANALHLAAVKAEAFGVASNFDALEDAAIRAQQAMSDQSALNAMEAANTILRDRLSTEEEIAAAQETLQNAALDYNLSQASRTNGWEMGVLNTPGDNDIRAATMDWQSLNSILEQSVPGFKEITDENERLSLALAHTSDEAQRAAIQIQQMLNESDNLTDNQKTGITRQLEQSDLSAEQSAQVVAALNIDKESTYNNIVPELQDILKQVNEGEDLQIVLKAKLSPEEFEEAIRSQIANYEPKDEDVDKESFDDLADTFYENKEQMGVEGTPFEDYSADLFENAEALENVVEGILRYNDAIESLDKSYDDWKNALENTGELTDEHLTAVRELQDTYSDFLGLSRKVSKNFASNAENLELMQEAAEGNTEAFEDLEDAAAADIYMQITGIDDLDEAKNKIEEINNILADSGIEEIPIGEIFNLDDFESVRQAINDELATLGLDAEEAARYVQDVWHLDIPADQFTVVEDDMSAAATNAENTANHVEGVVEGVADTIIDNGSFSVSSDIDSDTAEAEDTVTFTNLLPVPTGPRTITSQMPVGDGNTGTGTGVKMESFSASVYGVGYEPHTQTTTQFRQQTGFKEDVNVEKGAGKGHVGLPKGATGSRAPSGGAGRSGASRPSSGGGGGGGKGKSCFIAGTLVSIRNNEYQYIENICRGDIVLSYNEKTRQNEYSQVLQTMTHEINEEVYLICAEGTELNVTGNHKFFVKRNNKVEWVEAADLRVNDLMFFADYSWHEIWHIEVNIETTTVYNFEVSHNHNYYVGIDQILAHNKGGKGGSGGGGSAKTIKPKEKKEHEKDYYEEVDNQLKKTEKTLSKIEKENDRLTGDKARANQNKQLTLLEKELKLQEKKLKILTEQEKVDVAASLQKADKELEEFAKTLGIDWKMPDPVYDEDGIISNYEEMSAAINDLHNKLIEQYNAAAAAGNEELTKQIEEQLSKIDKTGEDLLKKAKRMNAIQTEIEDITATIEDLKDSIEDIRIEAYKASQDALKELVELKEQEAEIDALFHDANPNSYIDRWSIDGTPYVELKQVMQEINSISNIGMDQATAYFDNLIAERKKALETASEDEKAAIQSTIDFYTEEKSKLSEDNLENGILGIRRRNLEQLREWIDNPSNPSNPFGDNIAALQEAYKTEYEAMLDQAKEERERAQKARDAYLEIADDIQDGIERHIDGYDRLLDKLERINDTYQLYYGEDSYDGILDIMDQQANTMSSELDQLTNAYNYWTNQYQMALANGDEKLIHEIEDKMNDAEDAMLDKASELAEHFVEMYETSVNAAIQKMTNSLWSGGPGQMDLEDQSTMWELQKDYMQNYKDDVEKAFEVDKLRSKYIDLLNDAQGMSLQTQNKIRAQMQEQLDLLENQTTMSDYDVKLANAKLEILQKQIALEDAQRNKNKMQLRRDTQGNYRYVYSADQGDIKQAQDELNESRYDAYEMTKDQTIANNDRAISLYNDYMEKIAAISKKYQDDEAAREAALAALSEEYKGLFEALREDYADTTNGMYDVLTWMIDSVTGNTTNAAINMLNTLYDESGRIKENTGIAWQDLATQISTDVLPNISAAVVKTLNSINSNAQWLAQSMTGPGGVLTKIGSSAQELTNTLDSAAIATQKLALATNELFGYLAADDSELAKATEQMAEYEEKLKGALSETSKYAEALKRANAEIQAKTEEARNYKTKYEYASGQKELKKDSVVKVKQGTFVYYDRRGQDQYDDTGSYGWYLPQDMWVKLGTPNPDAPNAYNFYATGASLSAFGDRQEASGSDSRAGEAPANERHHQWWHLDEATLKRSIIDGLDTGGYTGEWNESTPFYKNGKVAMLHQKELVLNATDTQNILAAVEMIRSISGNNMANLLGKTGTNGLGFNISADYNPTTEQRVEIQATFPNATDADDIRTALLGLSDKAFQYAHRTI